MEVNKENKDNIKKIVKHISRIPLPLEPLPPLPKHLVHYKRINANNQTQNERHPLKTINLGTQLTLPGSSKDFNKIQKPVLKIDTRYVTVRQKDDLKWAGHIFKDDKNVDIVIISDDEEDEIVEKKYKDCERAAVTPALNSIGTLEPSRVRNIKRSLKRPHSKELQGLSPVTKEQNKDDKVRRRLRFSETVDDKLKSPDFWNKAYMKCLYPEYTSEIFPYLLGAEKRVALPMMSSTMRACIVNWLMKINGADGNPATVQAACWYLDSTLSTAQVKVDKLQLIAAACYWIAHKLHGPGLHASKLVKYSNNAFTTKDLLFAEKVVLAKLNYPRQPVVQQEYITYLSWWCDKEHPGEIEVGATFLTMCYLVVDKRAFTELPSVVAVAAVRNTLMLLNKTDLKDRLQRSPLYKAAEQKADSLSQICSSLRRAARTVASPTYEYKSPFEHYGVPPHYIANKMLNAANNPIMRNAPNTMKY